MAAATTTTTSTKQTQGFLATSTRKLFRPRFITGRTQNQHWRTSQIATSSPLSPLHEQPQPQQEQHEQEDEPGCPANATAPNHTTTTAAAAAAANHEPLAEIPLSPQPFPRWIRLKAIADFEQRQGITSQVADAISSTSGGFLSQSNMLSDMVTVLVLEDVDPKKLPTFEDKINSIKGVLLDDTSREILNDCKYLLKLEAKKNNHNNKGDDFSSVIIPETTTAVLQLNWRNAPGSLRHDIPMDG